MMRRLVALAAVCLLSTSAFAEEGRKAASDFKLKDLNGKYVRLSDFKGQVVVISFWATWCVPCLQELPYLSTYYDELKSKGFTVLAVTTDGPDTFARVRQTVARKKLTMPILLDQDGAVSQQLNVRGTQPFTVFIDRQGLIAQTHDGFSAGQEKEYRTIIDKLLTESK